MDKQDLKFDLLTQRYIVKRWSTPLGREVREKIIAAIEASKDVREILETYVLEHPANIDPYNYPYYPPDEMEQNEFFVLTNHDMRGIHFENKDFSGSVSLTKQNLSYAVFEQCNLSNIDFKKSDFSFAVFKDCNLVNAAFSDSGGVNTSFVNSQLNDAVMVGVMLVAPDFSGTDLRGVHFEDTVLSAIVVNYLTKFDKEIHVKWSKSGASMQQLPDLYRAVRVGYERANLNKTADFYLLQERGAYRKHVLWPLLMQHKTPGRFVAWFKDLIGFAISGYGTSPVRTFWYGFLISLVYAIIYTLAGVPKELHSRTADFLSAIYFSFTTFSTLGYGDLVYSSHRMFMRLLCTSEAWVGAIFIAFFVVVFSRKILR